MHVILVIFISILFTSCVTVNKGTFGPFELYKGNPWHGYNIETQIIDGKETAVEKFEVRDGDCFSLATNDCTRDRERSEIEETKDFRRHLEGKEVWYRWDFKIPKNFPNVGITLSQFYHKNKGPSWMFGYFDGYYNINQIIYPFNYYNLISKNELVEDTWNKIEINVKWTTNNDGFFKVWVNGKQKVDYKGRTSKDYYPYLKYGIYREGVSSVRDEFNGKIPTQVVYYANVKRSTTREGLE